MSSMDGKESIKEKKSLSAVLLLEVFNNNFQPLTNYSHLTLLPLVNTPILDYSLDWLQRYLVDETIIYCCTSLHSDEIRAHCRKWSQRYGNVMKLNVVSSENCCSLGDAMRDLYNKSLLKTDFILLNGPVIGNLDLTLLMKNFEAARKRDLNCVMSCVFLPGKTHNRNKSHLVDITVDATTGKLLSHSRQQNKLRAHVSTDLLMSSRKLKIWLSCEDPSLSICSSSIPSLFSDNFDYGTRDSLIQGIIEQEELLGCTINAEMFKEGYASLVSSLVSYDKVSRDIIKRRVFPMVPERSLSSQRIRYYFHPFTGSYWDPSAKFHKKSVGENVVIDAGTFIDPRCKMRNSVVGKHCAVKENVNINDSYMLSNILISKGCILDSCFLSEDAKLLPGVHLEPGVVLGSKTILGPNLKVNRCTKLVNEAKVATEKLDHFLCGNEGRAFLYENEEMDCVDSASQPIWGDKRDSEGEDRSDVVVDSSDEGSDDGEDEDHVDAGHPSQEHLSSDEEREQEFHREVLDSMINSFKNRTPIENVILEVNSSRHAYNITMENVLSTVTKCTMRVAEESNGAKLRDEKLWQSIKEGLSQFGVLIKNYIKKAKDQIVVLQAIQELVIEDNRFLPTLQRVLYEMSQEAEILDDIIIIYWYDKKEVQPSIAKVISKFIDWVRQNQENASESDDE